MDRLAGLACAHCGVALLSAELVPPILEKLARLERFGLGSFDAPLLGRYRAGAPANR